MSRAVLVLANDEIRRKAKRWIDGLPDKTRVEFKGPKRTIPQSDRMWAMLTDVATQTRWHGVRMEAEAWKLLFLDGLKREMQIIPNLDGTGFVNVGRSSSDLSKSEMSDMIELIFAFGANHDVTFYEPTIEDPRAPSIARKTAMEPA